MSGDQSRVLCWLYLLPVEIYMQKSGMADGQKLRWKSGKLLLSAMGFTQFVKV
jgi:hypothetical protein